jgi:GNAT superfamily N-acetyltransferase
MTDTPAHSTRVLIRPVLIRPVRDGDAADLILVVSACWDEYPGCVTDIDGEAPELRALATHLAGRGGAGWVAEQDGAAAGVVACWPRGTGEWELGKMYLAPTLRGTGVGENLLRAAEQHARAHGAGALVLWSDTRFSRAHAFYEKHGWLRHGPLRALDDRSHSIEFGYAKPLRGVAVRVLDAGAAASAVAPLAEVLIACVDGGAAISFLPPLSRDAARGFWRRTATAVAQASSLLVVGWLEGRLAGTVTVDCDMPPNQPHRADIRKLLVHPDARGRGLGRALMQAAETAAREAGRTLLTLDTKPGDASEHLYRTLGFREVGVIPGFGLDADGTPHDSMIFFKHLAA